MYTRLLLVAAALMVQPVFAASPPPGTVRFATFNASLFGEQAGQLVAELSDPRWSQARGAAAILQDVRPDVVLVNEFDWDAEGRAAGLFRGNFLAVGQDGRQPLDYPYVYVAETNTGVASGHDLDRDGMATITPGTRAYGGDAFGFGQFPGQYGFVVLSRFPILADESRSFRLFRWRDLPGASIPAGWYTDEALEVLRLSSKNHLDLPIRIGDRVVHLLASHPTPPTFDGPEDRNGARNADEIRFWSLYLESPGAAWLTDDKGVAGGFRGTSFVIVGDLNSDPLDGDSRHDAIRGLLAQPRLQGSYAPSSIGGVEQSRVQGGVNQGQHGNPAFDTADFDDRNVGNLRLDYVLPSVDLPVAGGGVYWPAMSDPRFALVGTYPFPVSDHRLVWVDVRIGTAPKRGIR